MRSQPLLLVIKHQEINEQQKLNLVTKLVQVRAVFIFSKNKNYYIYDYSFKDDGQEEEERVTPELQPNNHTWGIIDKPRKRIGTQIDVRYCCYNYCHGKRSPREFTYSLDRKRDKCGHIHVNCWANQTDIICKLCCPE